MDDLAAGDVRAARLPIFADSRRDGKKGGGVDFQDQDFSLVDRTSFAVMQRLGLSRVASLDHHFAVFRFGRGLRQAFEVVR